jgi:hypothetical protein
VAPLVLILAFAFIARFALRKRLSWPSRRPA